MLAPLRKSSLSIGQMHIFETWNFAFRPQNAIWKIHFFWHSLSILHKLILHLIRKTSMTFFSVFAKKIHRKMIQKTRILTPKINFNFGLCKMDNESKKTDFFKSNFVGKTQNLMLEKGPFSRYIMRVSWWERASVSVG